MTLLGAIALGWLLILLWNYAAMSRLRRRGGEYWWMFYSRYLKTWHWGRVRRITLFVGFRRCWYCHERGVILQAHHRNYRRLWFEIPIIDIIPLCLVCHGKETAASRRRNGR